MKVIQRPPPCPTASSLLTFSVFPQFRALAPMYYRGSAAAIIVYDITKEVFTFSPNPTKCGSYPLNFHGRYEFVCRIACPYPSSSGILPNTEELGEGAATARSSEHRGRHCWQQM